MIAIIPLIRQYQNRGLIVATIDDWGLVENAFKQLSLVCSRNYLCEFIVERESYSGFTCSAPTHIISKLGYQLKTRLCDKVIHDSNIYTPMD